VLCLSVVCEVCFVAEWCVLLKTCPQKQLGKTYGESNGHVNNDVTRSWKVNVITPIRIQRNISKTAGDAIATIALLKSPLWCSTVGYPSNSLASCTFFWESNDQFCFVGLLCSFIGQHLLYMEGNVVKWSGSVLSINDVWTIAITIHTATVLCIPLPLHCFVQNFIGFSSEMSMTQRASFRP